MIMLRCTFYPSRCEYQEGQEPCENKAPHNPYLLNPWTIVAGLARFAQQVQANALIERVLGVTAMVSARTRVSSITFRMVADPEVIGVAEKPTTRPTLP